MRRDWPYYALTITIAAGCGGESPEPAQVNSLAKPVAVAPVPEEAPTPVQPKPDFDPTDRERTYKWIREEMVPLQVKYRPAKKAIDDNPLNDDAMKDFLVDLPSFKAKVAGIVGSEVKWRVKVHSIDQNGVVIDGDGHEYTEPGSLLGTEKIAR